MGRKYAIRNPEGIYFITFTVVKWLKVFELEVNCHHFLNSLKYCLANKGLDVYAYCIMPDHIHLIIGAKDGYSLSGIIRDIKRHTAIQIRKELEGLSHLPQVDTYLKIFRLAGEKNSKNDGFQLWQQHNHPIELDTVDKFNQRLEYIHNNPISAELVDDPIDWQWSSARALELGGDSFIELTEA